MTDRAVLELACVVPACLDLTFLGLNGLPELGQEQFARELLRSPGGGALMAIAATRLGVPTAAAFPVGLDEAGDVLRAALVQAGAEVVGVPTAKTPVTVVMPILGERAMVTYEPEASWNWGAIAALEPRRVLCAINQLEDVPIGLRAFVSVSGRYCHQCATEALPSEHPIDTLLLNEREAMQLTGAPSVEHAARTLAEHADTVVVTLGARGAFAYTGGVVVTTPGVSTDVVDTTGAGDLFASAWIWGDVLGLDPQARLQWAVLYAALSVTVPTGAAGATTLEQLIAEGEKRGLRLPRALREVVRR
jgi:sugar/nucleoside kinase (ribokinase family)